MKSGLVDSLKNYHDYDVNVENFFPRSYDLGHANEVKEFCEDFDRTCLINLIKNHWTYFKKRVPFDII